MSLPEVNVTSATFAETGDSSGNEKGDVSYNSMCGQSFHPDTLFLMCYLLFTDISSRPKRSPNNPLDFLIDAKQFIIEANSLSFGEVFQNLGSNVNYGINKMQRVTNHITSSIR